MKSLTIIGVALGLTLGAMSAAHATGLKDCGGGIKVDWSKDCPAPSSGGTTNDNTATGGAANQSQGQAQGQAQGQSQGQSLTNSNTATNGGNSVSISNPSKVVTLGVGLNANVIIGAGVRDEQARGWAEFWGKGDPRASEAWCASPTGRKTASCKGGSSAPVCYFSKEDGMVHVSANTDVAACKRSLGIR